MTLQPGEILNQRYRIESVIAQGGMGAVYRGHDLRLDITIALKENLGITESFARQFRREGTVLASLVYPNLPRVTDHFSSSEGAQYLVMDFIPGEDLREMIKRLGPLPQDFVIRVGVTICDALSYLHTHQPPILHRDIKPGNIKINPEGAVFLVDFGLVKVVQGSGATTTGAQSLTPGYAPPEQYGRGTDQRSDIYSLGATLYAALTGKIPEDSISRAMGNSRLTPINVHRSDISPGFSMIIEKALAIEPENRFQTAQDFKEAMQELIPDLEPTVSAKDFEKTVQVGKSGKISPGKDSQKKFTRVFLVLGSAVLIVFLAITSAFVLSKTRNQYYLTPVNTPTISEMTSIPGIMQPGESPFSLLSPKGNTQPVITPTLKIVPIPTTIGGGKGMIAFSSNRDGIPQIYLMDPSGGEVQKITSLSDGACQPAWSPDGRQLVFISPCAGNEIKYPHSSLFRINSDGTGISPLLTAPGGYYDPDWSPDGSQITFVSLRDSLENLTSHIYTLDLIGGKIKRLSTGSDLAQRRPQFSPDGTKMLFEDDRFIQPQIFVTDLTGEKSESRSLTTSSDGPAQFPYWSPDGNEIIYTQNTSSPGIMLKSLIQVNSKPIPINDYTRPARNGSFSPDGTWVVYESGGEIMIMTRSGENITNLTNSEKLDFDPAWQP